MGKPLAATGWFAAGYFLAWIRLFTGGNFGPMDDRTGGLARFPDGECEQCIWRHRADCGGRLPMDPAQGRVSRPMPDARSSSLMRHGGFRGDLPGCLLLGLQPRRLLRRLLLGSDGTFVCGRGDERTLDRAPRAARSSGEAYSVRTVDCTRRRRCVCRRGRRDVVIFAAVMSRLLIHVNASFTTSPSSAPCHAD